MGVARAFEHVLWPRVHLLTANVKRRNLLRRTGFLRAAPDFMDSHICQKKKKKKGVKVSYQAALSFPLSSEAQSCTALNSSFPQARHHFSQAMKWAISSLCPFPTPLYQPLWGKWENPEASSQWVSACLCYFLQQIFTCFLVYTGASGLWK